MVCTFLDVGGQRELVRVRVAGPLETLVGTMKADAEQASARVRVMRDM